MKFRYATAILVLTIGGVLFAETGENSGTEPSGKLLLLGGRLTRLNKNDEKLNQLAETGKIDEAVAFITDNWKNLESCIGYRAIQGEPRRKILASLGQSGFIDYTNDWDHLEVLLTDPLGHFTKLLPTLKVNDLSDAPDDQIISLFKHPDFPKAWLAEDICAWLALRALKRADEDENVLNEILACGIPASSIVKTQTGFSSRPLKVVLMDNRSLDKTVCALIKKNRLKFEDRAEREVVFNVLLRVDDPTLWAAASKQNLQWSTKVDQNGHFVEHVPDSLKDFSGWLKL